MRMWQLRAAAAAMASGAPTVRISVYAYAYMRAPKASANAHILLCAGRGHCREPRGGLVAMRMRNADIDALVCHGMRIQPMCVHGPMYVSPAFVYVCQYQPRRDGARLRTRKRRSGWVSGRCLAIGAARPRGVLHLRALFCLVDCAGPASELVSYTPHATAMAPRKDFSRVPLGTEVGKR